MVQTLGTLPNMSPPPPPSHSFAVKMKHTAVFSLFPFYIFNEEQFKFFNFLKLQKKKKAQIETSLCSAVTARRNGGRKSRPVRREDGGYAEGEKEEGGGRKRWLSKRKWR